MHNVSSGLSMSGNNFLPDIAANAYQIAPVVMTFPYFVPHRRLESHLSLPDEGRCILIMPESYDEIHHCLSTSRGWPAKSILIEVLF